MRAYQVLKASANKGEREKNFLCFLDPVHAFRSGGEGGGGKPFITRRGIRLRRNVRGRTEGEPEGGSGGERILVPLSDEKFPHESWGSSYQ